MTQTVTNTTYEPLLPKIRFFDGDHQPSWKIHAKGSASLEVSSHRDNRYLSITARESAHESQATKCVMMTLTPTAALEFYHLLGQMLKGELPAAEKRHY